MRVQRVAWGAVLACGVLAIGAGAQQAANRCSITVPVVSAQSQPNMFSMQQELWLGDAMRDLIESSYRAGRDPALNAHLQMLVDRLAKNLPEPHVAFHVVLVDSSEVNGFSIAGGYIYINRRLAATVNGDDELAAVLGHEMGHIASHQFAFDMTAQMKRLLHVDKLGDKSDVYAKFQELEDAAMKDKHPPKSKEDDNQDEADRIGVYLTAAAGYRPQALGEFWDRTFFVGGKTGSKFSDFFGITRPDQKRLRGMLKVSSELPEACRQGTAAAAGLTEFATWQREVIANQKGHTTDVASGPEAKPAETTAGTSATVSGTPAASSGVVKLEGALQMELNRVRFSPDGTLVLAQDESSIYVLTRDPWAVKFRMDADRAQDAWFSPDSRRVTFSTPGLHTEIWSVDGKLLEAHEPVSRHECLESKLSPDGRTIVCETLDLDNFEIGLSLLDAISGATLWENKNFFQPNIRFATEIYVRHAEELPSDVLWSSFSGDGNFLLIGPGDQKVGFDLRTRTPVKLGSDLKGNVSGPFAFLGSDRVAGVNAFDKSHSGVFSFPDGKRLSTVPFVLSEMQSVADPGDNLWVLTDTVQQVAADGKTTVTGKEKNKDGTPKEITRVEQKVAIADLKSLKYVLASKSTALDAWRDYLATEGPDGKLVLMKQPDQKGAKVSLPLSPLGHLRAVAMSPNGRFLAYSTRDRGGLWDLKTSRRLGLLRAFVGATWTDDKTVYLAFPKTANKPREFRSFDMMTGKSTVMENVSDETHMRYGYLMEWKKDPKKHDGGTLTMHRLGSNDVAWSKAYTDAAPRFTASADRKELICTSPTGSNYAKAILKSNPALGDQLALLKVKDHGRLVEVVNDTTGEVRARMVLELAPDYVGVDGLNSAGDQLYVTGEDNRTLVYSLTTGKKLWQVFGYVVALDATTQRATVINRSDEAVVYDAAGQELAHLHGGETIRFASFQASGAKLEMLMADQTVRTVDVPALTASR